MMADTPGTPEQPDPDVRMRGFKVRSTVADAQAWLDAQLATRSLIVNADVPVQRDSSWKQSGAQETVGKGNVEEVGLANLAGRVLATSIVSGIDVPGFDRAMMDGYAVRSDETMGASPYNQLAATVVGQSLPGQPFSGAVGPGQAVRIMTGAPIPPGADAVLPAERCDCIEPDQLRMSGEVTPGKHVGRRGEDVQIGAEVLRAGRRLRPQDVGVLSSIGKASVPVVRHPLVHIIVTGDELLAPGSLPHGCQIADSNGPMLEALVRRDGGVTTAASHRIVPDNPEAILESMRTPAQVVLVSGGSSVGQEDHAPVLLGQQGELSIHGVTMRPSSPAGMGLMDGALVFLLPGNPVSCLCAYDFFAGRAIRQLAGLPSQWPYRVVSGSLARKLVSTVGRTDYARVRFQRPVDPASALSVVEPLAVSGASVLSSTTRADGFIVVPPDSEGYPAGCQVEVYCYD